MPLTPTNIIPLYYRVFFLYFDSLLCIAGVYAHFVAPSTIIKSTFPELDVEPGSRLALTQLTGFELQLLVVILFLLRPLQDVGVWKPVQAGVLFADIGCLWSLFEALGPDRILPSAWSSDDSISIAISATCAVSRLAFLLGVGFKGRAAVKKTK